MSQSERKAELLSKLEAVRGRTVSLLDHVPSEVWKRRIHGFYSPIGWHFGHVGRTEEFWACNQAMGDPVLSDRLTFLYHDCPENPKDNRVNVPNIEETLAYMAGTRERAADALDRADLDNPNPLIRDGYAWEFAFQHECQHQETIAEMLHLVRMEDSTKWSDAPTDGGDPVEGFVELAGGTFEMGSDDPFGYDNEARAHTVKVAPFHLAATQTSVQSWVAFIADGGYSRPELWSKPGWAWKESESVRRPAYWLDDKGRTVSPRGVRQARRAEPVFGVSHYEAQAFAKWSNARLPTEAEWEFAASAGRFPWGDAEPTERLADFGFAHPHPQPVNATEVLPNGVQGLAGGVWEHVSTAFLPYPGFKAFPYDGYSFDHMDGRHFGVRGGSFATAPAILRRTFRNWYVPTYREGFLGVRLAR